MSDFKKGDKVIVYPPSYPNQVYEGTVLRKTPNGYSVQVVLNGMGFRETYPARVIKHAGELKNNPTPRIGTARPRRVSQVTKKPPTKRLVTRRKANVKAGYFPNPVNPPLNETEFMVHLYRSKELAMKKAGTVVKRQAAVSYAEGMATGAMLLGLFDRKERDTFMSEIGAAHGVK